jgi:expansin (peptidoglycan-binding protein)
LGFIVQTVLAGHGAFAGGDLRKSGCLKSYAVYGLATDGYPLAAVGEVDVFAEGLRSLGSFRFGFASTARRFTFCVVGFTST